MTHREIESGNARVILPMQVSGQLLLHLLAEYVLGRFNIDDERNLLHLDG